MSAVAAILRRFGYVPAAAHRVEVRRETLREAVVEIEAAWREADCGCVPCHGHAERDATYEHCRDIVDGLAGEDGR